MSTWNHRKIELPGKCYWCLGDWHKHCVWENRCRCCSRYIPDMRNGGKKHACAMNVESAPAHSKGKGKGSKGGKGKAHTPNTSKAFTDHKTAMAEKRAVFKRQAKADQLAKRALNKNQKKSD